MAETRTVHRGSRGRFAGASAGKPEKVKVGRGYARSSPGKQVSMKMKLGASAKKAGAATGRGALRIGKGGLGVAQVGVGIAAFQERGVAMKLIGAANVIAGVSRTEAAIGGSSSSKASRNRARPPAPSGPRIGKNAYRRKNARARQGNATRRKQRALGLR